VTVEKYVSCIKSVRLTAAAGGIWITIFTVNSALSKRVFSLPPTARQADTEVNKLPVLYKTKVFNNLTKACH